ncbi:BolA/IbaG family iron-sulfur metabolism protein [bacterium SCSIO 12696]|nr:BolA/IbaG family iron-sulfur metabolism protein [bacterium SCSIO 12696]
MNLDEIKQLLAAQLDGCQIEVEAEGNHLTVSAVGELFAGLRTLKRQQLIYGALSELIADGTIHAVHMTTLTPEEAGQ